MYLICHVTLTNHLIKGSCDFMEQSSSLYVTTLPGLVCPTHCGSRDIIYLIYQLTSLDHEFKGCMTLWWEASHSKLPSCQVWWLKALW